MITVLSFLATLSSEYAAVVQWIRSLKPALRRPRGIESWILRVGLKDWGCGRAGGRWILSHLEAIHDKVVDLWIHTLLIGQRHRVWLVDIAQIGPGHYENIFVCVQRPTHPVSPYSVVRRLAGARYQVDG